MAKDFFDEEFEKSVQQKNESQESEQQPKTDFDSWYNRPAPVKEEKKPSKPLYIVLTCFVLIACIGFGWLLCYLVDEITTPEEEKILRTVIEYLKNNYYEDVDNWTEAIEYSGSALMYKAGDRFCQLMAPQTYYDFMYETGSSNKVFGVSFYVDDMGLYVASVATNSNAYGWLYEGDFVLKLTNVKGVDGEPLLIEGETYSEITISDWSSLTVQYMMDLIESATFHVLRQDDSEVGYKFVQVDLAKGEIPAVDGNQLSFIEYYFDEDHKNISTRNMGDARISTYEERSIESLDEMNRNSETKTGYIRITQFMDYVATDSLGNYRTDSDGNILRVTASSEFKSVMNIFKNLGYKRLVLDLKGNPGGNVAYVSEIAGMLVTDAKLTLEQRKEVMNSKGELLMSYLEMPKPVKIRDNYYAMSSYADYFGILGDKYDIVVWTDGGSASGSEMLTGVLRDYQTAIQMGVTTYGKGIAQAVQPLPFTGKVKTLDGKTEDFNWAIYYTCAKYYSPFGVNIHKDGYTPETPYNGLKSYESLWEATANYWA